MLNMGPRTPSYGQWCWLVSNVSAHQAAPGFASNRCSMYIIEVEYGFVRVFESECIVVQGYYMAFDLEGTSIAGREIDARMEPPGPVLREENGATNGPACLDRFTNGGCIVARGVGHGVNCSRNARICGEDLGNEEQLRYRQGMKKLHYENPIEICKGSQSTMKLDGWNRAMFLCC